MIAPAAGARCHRFRVQLHDTDTAGVLFFAHLFRYAHDAYEAAMAGIGWPIDRLIRERTLALPVVHADASFRRPLRHGDDVHVALGLDAVQPQRFQIGYQFWRDEVLAATVQTVHAALDPGSGRACSLPQGLRDALGGLIDQRGATDGRATED